MDGTRHQDAGEGPCRIGSASAERRPDSHSSLCDRFRHLDTMVRLKARRGSSSPSPESEPRDEGGSGSSGGVSPLQHSAPPLLASSFASSAVAAAAANSTPSSATSSPRRSPAFPRKLHFGRSSAVGADDSNGKDKQAKSKNAKNTGAKEGQGQQARPRHSGP